METLSKVYAIVVIVMGIVLTVAMGIMTWKLVKGEIKLS